MKSLVPAAAAAGLLGAMIYGASGCELIASVDRAKIDQGTGGSAGGGGSTGGSDGGGGTNAGGGGSMGCEDAACAATGTTCAPMACDEDTCAAVMPQPGTDTACEDGAGFICNGAGMCVAPGCLDNVLNNGETAIGSGMGMVDGDGMGLDCGGDNCGPCVNDEECDDADDCQSAYCDTSGAGGGGGGGGMGGGGGAGGMLGVGVCTACAPADEASQCADDRWCDGTVNMGTCVADKAQGEACGVDGVGTANDECSTDFCTDGFCCNEQCGDTCEACSAVLSVEVDGTCGAIDLANDVDPDGDCDADNATCETNDCSNIRGACGTPGVGTSCGNTVTCQITAQCTDTPGAGCPANGNVGPGLNATPFTDCAGGCCDGAGQCGANNCNDTQLCDADGDCTNDCDHNNGGGGAGGSGMCITP